MNTGKLEYLEECRKIRGIRRMQEGWSGQKNAGRLEGSKYAERFEGSEECR